MSWTSSGVTWEISVVAPKKTSRSSWSLRPSRVAACGDLRTSTRSFLNDPSGFSGAFACETMNSSSSSAVSHTISSVTLPLITLR